MCHVFNCALAMLTCTCLVMVAMDLYLLKVIILKKDYFESTLPDYAECLGPKL